MLGCTCACHAFLPGSDERIVTPAGRFEILALTALQSLSSVHMHGTGRDP